MAKFNFFGIPKFVRGVFADSGRLKVWLNRIGNVLKILGEIAEAIAPKYSGLIDRAEFWVEEAQEFSQKSGPEKREYVFDALRGEFAKVPDSMINTVIELVLQRRKAGSIKV